MEDLKTTEGIPVMQSNREIAFDDETLEKLAYLKSKGEGNKSDVCNTALKAFLVKKFKEQNLEHYSDPMFEANHIAIKERLEREAKARDDFRLLELAKARILQQEVEKIRVEEAKIREEEKRTGKKLTKEPLISVKMLKNTQYESMSLTPGMVLDIPASVCARWVLNKIAIKKG